MGNQSFSRQQRDCGLHRLTCKAAITQDSYDQVGVPNCIEEVALIAVCSHGAMGMRQPLVPDDILSCVARYICCRNCAVGKWGGPLIVRGPCGRQTLQRKKRACVLR